MEYIDGSIFLNSFVLGLCLLILAFFVAGFIDAIAGGAGLVLVPSFILAGLPPQIALGQEKLVSTLGTLSAIFNFIKSKKIIWNFALIGVPIALLGAYAGARAILFLDENMVGKIIATFMPFGLFFSFLPKKQSASECEISGFRRVFIFPLMAFVIGFYDGFFGPGTGSLLILALHYVMKLNLTSASATSKIFNLASNIGAFVAFAIAGKMLFLIGVPMIVASVVGNFIGSHLAINKGDVFIRPVLFGVIFLLFATLVYRYFLA